MSFLVHVKHLVDQALDELTQENQRMLKNTIIAIRRLRPSWLKYFEAFQVLLKKIEQISPRCYFFQKYMFYLEKNLNEDAWKSLYNYLFSKDYTDNKIATLQIEYDEGAFFNRLSKNTSYLFVSLFYLYQPALTEKFIKLELLHYLTVEEEDLLSNYRSLSPTLQAQVSSYMDQIVDAHKLKQKYSK